VKSLSEEALFDTNEMTSSKRYLHTPSEFARKKLIYVQETGKLKSIKPHVSSRSNLESYLFMVVMSGNGRVSFDGKDYSVKAGDCAFIDCRRSYEHCSGEDSQWELMWVHMDGALLRDYYGIFLEKNGGSPVFKAADIKKYSGIIDEVMSNQDEKDITSEYVSHNLLTNLVTTMLVEIINEDNKKLNPDILNSIRESVNARFKEEDLLESVCGEYGMDEIAINRQFKDKYGIDLCDYILNRRFNCAKELLRFSVKPVKEIVVESGIMNTDLFRHLFIENEGMTAEEYRKKWAQWNRG
jgi:hypothetical protein